MRRIAVCLIVGSALASGCARHEAAQNASSAAAASAPAGPAAFLGRPHPKAGLWRTSMTTNAGPGVSMTGELCLDASNEDAAFSSNGRGFRKDCEPVKYEAAPGGYGFSVVCHMGRRTVTTTGTATGDFKSAYSVDLSTRMEPSPPGLPAQLHTSIQAKWVGPCPAGTKPGQVSMRVSGFGQG